MAAAFKEVTGREPLDTESDEDAVLWNAAWEHALTIFPDYVRPK
jgi:hypothetical protein